MPTPFHPTSQEDRHLPRRHHRCHRLRPLPRRCQTPPVAEGIRYASVAALPAAGEVVAAELATEAAGPAAGGATVAESAAGVAGPALEVALSAAAPAGGAGSVVVGPRLK
jgi:hypothetical protein